MARHVGGVDEVDHVGADGGDAVGAVGVGEQREADAVAVDDERVLLVALLAVAVGAEVGYAEGVEHAQGALQPRLAAIHAVVVGGGEDVEAGLFGGHGQLARRRELGVARVGRSGQRYLEVEDGQVGAADVVAHVAEAGRVVVGAISLQGSLVLRRVPHEVAGEDELQALRVQIGSCRQQQKEGQQCNPQWFVGVVEMAVHGAKIQLFPQTAKPRRCRRR